MSARSVALSVLLSGFVLGSLGASTGLSKPDDSSANHACYGVSGPIIACATASAFALVLFLLSQYTIRSERVVRERAIAALRAQYAELLAQVLELQVRFDALPMNDFMRQADIKIAELRQQLEDDARQQGDAINHQLIALQAETDRMAQELARRQVYLENMWELLESVRDNNNEAFLERIIAMKLAIEAAFEKLSQDKIALYSNVNDLTARMHELSSYMDGHHTEIDRMNEDMQALKQQASSNKEQADAVQRYSKRVFDEVALAKRNVVQAEQEFGVLNNDLKTKLRMMEEMSQSSKAQKEMVEGQVEQARKVLNDVRARMAQLNSITAQEEQRVHELSNKVARARDVADRLLDKAGSDKNSTQPMIQAGKNNTSPIDTAIIALKNVLADFAIDGLGSALTFRKAYLKFCLKNHPDKGGDKDLFQAVDGLYKVLLDNNLFDSPSALISGRVLAVIDQYVTACNRFRSRSIK
ncbi:MAG: hypothetical protein QG604_797 [Candidatus Dependentiae bacterium]|nr:hypothetical protein [Candidatus Dependentiae bacterium]